MDRHQRCIDLPAPDRKSIVLTNCSVGTPECELCAPCLHATDGRHLLPQRAVAAPPRGKPSGGSGIWPMPAWIPGDRVLTACTQSIEGQTDQTREDPATPA